MKTKVVGIASWVVSLWIIKVFVSSLPYKFSNHPDTQHIFTTIGDWIGLKVNAGLVNWFGQQGALVVGSAELVASVILILPALLWIMHKTNILTHGPNRAWWHGIGGLLSAVIMMGAVFFHLFSPLGLEVLHQGKSDGGSLFYAAASILVLGGLMALSNLPLALKRQ